ncbi:putative Ig domain-containing protein [Actinoplanes sp. CA-051413]|uniref:putative Ig domain-containing protein n=1 Tax=Actinoplanes sp. CA-051413 TaxID=3239899 RepID=UPI003D993F3E
MPTDRAIVATCHGPRKPVRAGGPRLRGTGDDGLSVVEVIVALAVIGTVMTAMLPFLVTSVVMVSQQRDEQAAVEIANDALERARALKPSSLLVGRGEQTTKKQWADAPDRVRAYLTTMKQDWDPADVLAGAAAPLPTEPRVVTVYGTRYSQNWYVGRCWQPRVDPSKTVVADCAPALTQATDVAFFQVVVAVTWTARRSVTQGSCVQGVCAYVATTLVSPGTDPIFDIKRPPPTVTTPPTQYGYVNEAANLQLAATGGWLPRTWTQTGLPPGLTLDPGTGTITGTPTTVGSSSVTVVVTDRDSKTDDATFTWAIAQPPALTSPGDQTSRIGIGVNLAIAVTGGHTPRVWSATGLPAGLTINTSTGVITGNPTTEAKTMQPVTVTVVDAGKKTASVSFGWRVLTQVQAATPPTQTFASGSSAGNFTVPVSGGLPPYTWQASGLPDGFSMSTAGVVTGVATNGTRYVVTAVVTDSAGGTATVTVVCNVTPQNNDLRVTSPLVDRTSTIAAALPGNATASNGSAGRTWSSSGLPPGVTFSAGGVFGGKPTTTGTYIVKLTVQDNSGRVANTMFTWKVTP